MNWTTRRVACALAAHGDELSVLDARRNDRNSLGLRPSRLTTWLILRYLERKEMVASTSRLGSTRLYEVTDKGRRACADRSRATALMDGLQLAATRILRRPSLGRVLWAQAVRALVRGELPDYSVLSDDATVRAFQDSFGRWYSLADAASALAEKVANASGDRAILEHRDVRVFKGGVVRGPAAYLSLTVDKGEGRLLIMGPYKQPFVWDD